MLQACKIVINLGSGPTRVDTLPVGEGCTTERGSIKESPFLSHTSKGKPL
jgi:hypothetical protein